MTEELEDIEKRIDWGAMLLLLSYGPDEQSSLADTLYKLKVDAYEEAIYQESRRMGFDTNRSSAVLENQQTKAVLRKQANKHAGYIVNTHNSDLAKHISELEGGSKYPLRNRFQLAQDVDKWASERFSKRLGLLSSTESFTPLMRGTIDFYRQNGIDTDFIFNSHPASCDLCKRLEQTNPHSIRKVLRVGSPHPGCVHSWTPVVGTPTQPPGGRLWLGGAYRAQEAA